MSGVSALHFWFNKKSTIFAWPQTIAQCTSVCISPSVAFISAFDLLLEKNIHKEEDILVKYKFVVLPLHEPKKIIDNHHINTIDKHNNLLSVLKSADFYKFWSLDSACIQNANVFKRNSVVISCKNAYWSTFYTDPKSDLISKVSIDLNDRL